MPEGISQAALPRRFRFSATPCGIKKNNRPDLALISSAAPAAAAAVFTTNRVRAAPVELSRAHLRRSGGRMRAVVVNSGNANACTGPEGIAASRATAAAVARALGCRPEEVLVCSTGVIGVPLPVERILRSLPQLSRAQDATPAAFASVTRAILTTDTRPKWAAASCRIGGKRVRLLGCAKGAGMIAPNMATMLAFVLTDAAAPPGLLQRALREVAASTFNRITVDGDTSTNDTLALLANGASGAPTIRGRAEGKAGRRLPRGERDYFRFVAALETVCRELALAIVADGEGARRVVEIEVRSAPSAGAAEQVARAIGTSPLVKTALAGADPNWGRILAAAGRAGVPFNPARTRIWLAGIQVYAGGRAVPFDERATHRKLSEKLVKILVDLRGSKTRRNSKLKARHPPPATRHSATIWTCDFTADYVRINADYHT